VKCNECKRWQGRRDFSTWGNCHYVIRYLIPDFDNIRDRFGFNISLPFDPHDTKYLIDKMPTPHSCDLGDGVRIVTRKEKDTVYDDDGNERTKTVRLDYYCGYEEV
jgi:hypothetical protein